MQPPHFVLRWFQGPPGESPLIWQRGVLVVFGICLLSMVLWVGYSADRMISAYNQSKATVREVANIVPEDATLLAFGLTLTLQHYTDLNVVELYNLNEETLDAATASTLVYLLLDLENVAQQWKDRPPALNYEWLRTHRTLTPVADLPPYSLYLVSQRDKPSQ